MPSGLSAFSVTPADENGRVDTDHLQRLIARLAGESVDSIGVLGSTGSYMYLDRAERDRAIYAAVEAAGETPVLAGIGALRSSDVFHHAKSAQTAGAAAVLLAPVSYIPLTDRDFSGLVKDLAACADLPICLYNNPGTTHFSISESLTADLAQIDCVKAVKNPAPADAQATTDQINRMRGRVPEGFVLGYSGDAKIAGPLQAGADAWYSVLAGTLPKLCVALWRARNDRQQLMQLNDQYAPIWDLFDQYGSIRVVPHMLNCLGLGPVTSPRPLLPLPDDAITQIEAVLSDLSEMAAT